MNSNFSSSCMGCPNYGKGPCHCVLPYIQPQYPPINPWYPYIQPWYPVYPYYLPPPIYKHTITCSPTSPKL